MQTAKTGLKEEFFPGRDRNDGTERSDSIELKPDLEAASRLQSKLNPDWRKFLTFFLPLSKGASAGKKSDDDVISVLSHRVRDDTDCVCCSRSSAACRTLAGYARASCVPGAAYVAGGRKGDRAHPAWARALWVVLLAAALVAVVVLWTVAINQWNDERVRIQDFL